MPQAIRSNKKAAKIAYDIIGKPQNFDDKSIFKHKDTDVQIQRQETYRVR